MACRLDRLSRAAMVTKFIKRLSHLRYELGEKWKASDGILTANQPYVITQSSRNNFLRSDGATRLMVRV